MGKRTQKLLVYLDQNFLSGISRAAGNEKLRPFKEIYQLFRQGFVDEKLVVPGSLLHVDDGCAALQEVVHLCTQRYAGASNGNAEGWN